MTEVTDGNCFEVAANIVALFDMPVTLTEAEQGAIKIIEAMGQNGGDLLLTHGLVTRPTDGYVHAHAWVEIPHMNLVIDYSNGHSAVVHKQRYYELGGIKDIAMVQYGQKDTRNALVNHATYGPWDEMFNEKESEDE